MFFLFLFFLSRSFFLMSGSTVIRFDKAPLRAVMDGVDSIAPGASGVFAKDEHHVYPQGL